MRAVFRISACVLLLMCAWLRLPRAAAQAEDGLLSADSIPKFLDCSDSQTAYGEAVAFLNQLAEKHLSGQAESGAKIDIKGLYPVLCRTDGVLSDFDLWSPACVVSGPLNCYTLYFTSETAAEKVVSILSRLSGILYAERDMEVEACALTFHSWGAESMAYGQYLDYSDRIAGGSATVAVIDSGMYPHPLYAERMPESGYDYIDADYDATNDPCGHGTNVAGVMADCTQGFPVLFYPIRVLDSAGGGSVSNTVNGIREAIGKRVDVINLSLAAKQSSRALNDAVLDALNAGITVVAAAGNASEDVSQFSPANLTDAGVIVVGAAEADGSLASYTNYGSSVDLYAYGSDILCCSNSGGYTSATGTSIAAPHIAGLASLLILTHNGISPEEIETRIRLSTDLTAAVNVPDLVRIIPADPGFSLSLLRMDMQDSIRLPVSVRPASALESVSYTGSDPTVVSVRDGELTPVSPGRAEITAQCPGLADIVFSVEVTDAECMKALLPRNIKRIESEAFSGNSLITHVILPDGCESVAAGAFDRCSSLSTVEVPASLQSLPASFSDAVVICPADESIEELLKQHQISYILYP